MLSEWLKILIPVLLTAILAMIAGVMSDIKRIDNKQQSSAVYIFRIEQNELKIKELEKNKCTGTAL